MIDEELYNQLPEETKEWVTNQIRGINRELFMWFAFISLAFMTPIIMHFFKPPTEYAGVWLQRSGSIIVVFALLAEIKSNSIENMAISKSHTFLYCNMYLKSRYENKIKFITYFTYSIVAVGTIVWGYGDILVPYIASTMDEAVLGISQQIALW